MQIVPIGPPHIHDQVKRGGKFEDFAVRLSPRAYAAAWLGISLLHVVCGAYLVVAGVVFWVLPGLTDMYYIDYYAVALPSQHFSTVAAVHFGVAAVHAVLLWRPLLRRAWTSATVRYPRISSTIIQRVDRRRRHTWLWDRLRWSVEAIVTAYWSLFARTGLFGVQGRYYEVFFAINEVLDIVLQTKQALQMSQQLPHPALNRFYVATLVLNCFVTPFVHVVVADKPLQRLVCRLGDIALDFAASVVVPTELARRFYRYYDPATRCVSERLWYDDTWFIQTLKEAPIVLFGSWFDASSRLAFSIGLIMSLNSVKNLLRPATRASRSQQQETSRHTNDVLSSRTLRVLHGLMVSCGVAILGIHLHAEARAIPAACALEIRPWLTAQPACALVEFNCFNHRARNGNATEFEHVFEPLYKPSLRHIVFRHCSHIEITALIQDFHELVGFKTYNSTVVTWEENAAFTQTHHPHMRFAFFVRTNFSNGDLPRGLLSTDDFPDELRDLEISISNIFRLPDDLHERWPPDMTLVIEFAQLTEVAPTLLQLHLSSLCLDGNQIRELPVDILVLLTSRVTSFSGNPIAALPEATESIQIPTLARRRLRFASTQLSKLPAWMTTPEFLARTRVVATDTPLCQSILDARASHSGADELPLWAKVVQCDASVGGVGYYPQDVDERESELIW